MTFHNVSYVLLYIPYFNLARATPPSLSAKALRMFDEDVRRCFSASTGIDTSDDAWQQAQLSLSKGGLGLRSLSHHASAAFIASLSSSGSALDSVQNLSDAVSIFNHLVPVADSIQVESLLSSAIPQKILSQKLDNHLFSSLLKASTIANKARLLSVSSLHAAFWLSVPPCERQGLHLDPSQFQVAIKGGLVWIHLVAPSVPCVQKKALTLLAITQQHANVGEMLCSITTGYKT